MPMWCLEASRHPSWKSPRAAGVCQPDSKDRQLCRVYGLGVAAILWTATLAILPLAFGPTIYGFLQLATLLWPILLAGLVAYIFYPRIQGPRDLELVGMWIRNGGRDRLPLESLRGQLIKAFFLPLMTSFSYSWIADANPGRWFEDPHWYFFAIAALYAVDTIFATIGYLSTSTRLGSDIRSTNPYALAWASALVCYPPFFQWLQDFGFNYRDGLIWSHWISEKGVLYYAWGGAIIALTGIYALSSVVFGIRFSNLTNRGIITHGPYRFTKHPAYICKNVSWWLISVPFLSTSGVKFAVASCVILLCINCIYYMRAKTEERHLMHDPVYRAYAAWISKHGLFARVKYSLKVA